MQSAMPDILGSSCKCEVGWQCIYIYDWGDEWHVFSFVRVLTGVFLDGSKFEEERRCTAICLGKGGGGVTNIF